MVGEADDWSLSPEESGLHPGLSICAAEIWQLRSGSSVHRDEF